MILIKKTMMVNISILVPEIGTKTKADISADFSLMLTDIMGYDSEVSSLSVNSDWT